MTETKLFGMINQRQENWLIFHIQNDRYLNSSNILNLEDAEHLIDRTFPNSEKYCMDLLNSCKSELLEEKEFQWLNPKDKRLCSWAWSYIIKKPLTYNNNGIETPCYIPVNIPPTDSEDRINNIIKIFDINFRGGQQYKLDYMHNLKQVWGNLFPNLPSYSWLNSKDSDQITWAWSYLKDNRVINFNQQVINIKEQHLAIIAACDTWQDHPDSLKLIIDGAKRAWSQKKHRDSRGDRKAYNFIMATEVKEQLNIIASEKNMRLYEVLEWLITTEAKKETK